MNRLRLVLLLMIPAGIYAQNNKVIINAGKDAAIDLANGVATTNWGSLEESGMFAWTSGGKPVTGRALIWFDLSMFNTGHKINLDPSLIKKATLHLYTPETPGYVPQGNKGENLFQVFRITSPWDENTVTWGTAPTYDATLYAKHDVVSVQYNTEIATDVTSLIKKMALNNSTNYGLYIRLANESTYRSIAIGSRENVNSLYRPWLEIEMAQTNTGTPEISFGDLNIYQSAKETIHCSFTPAETGIATYTLFTLSGQQLVKQSIGVTANIPSNTEWHTGVLPAGVYLVRVEQNNSVRHLKIVVSN